MSEPTTETVEVEDTGSESESTLENQTEAREFYYATHTDPRRYQPGAKHGIYLDDIERRNAEIQRAKVEGREPDLDNPPASQGTPLLTRRQLNPDGLVPVGVTPDVILPVVVTVSDGSGHHGGDQLTPGTAHFNEEPVDRTEGQDTVKSTEFGPQFGGGESTTSESTEYTEYTEDETEDDSNTFRFE